jgi:perosamine synthetase
MNPALIEEAISPQTRAILVVHLMGHPCDVDRIRPIADRYNLPLIGDSAQAHFATYMGVPAGGLLDAETFSFHVGKILTCGEGGAITTSNPVLAKRLRFLKSHGMDPKRRFFHPEPAFNFRLTNTHAGFLSAQINRKNEILLRREEIFNLYDELLVDVPYLKKRPVNANVTLCPWVYALVLDSKHSVTVDTLMGELASRGIESRPMYYPLNALPMFSEEKYILGEIDISANLSKSVFYLPTFFDLQDHQIEYICGQIKSLLMIS